MISYKQILFRVLIVAVSASTLLGGIKDDWTGLLQEYRDDTRAVRLCSYKVTPIEDNKCMGEIFLGNRMVISVVLPAGGFRSGKRAHIICERLNHYVDEQAYLEPVRVERWGEEWVVTLGGALVATAATGTSRYYSMSRRELANRWADKLRTAFTDLIGPGAQVVRGNPPVEKLKVSMPPWDDRYEAIAKGDKAFERGEFEAAVRWYRTSLKEDPSAYDGHYKLGMALMQLNLLTQAREQFAGAIQLRPAYSPAREALDKVDRLLQ